MRGSCISASFAHFGRGEFVVHRFKQFFQKPFAVHVVHNKHLPCAFVGQFVRCVGHKRNCRFDGFYQKSVVVYAANDFPAIVNDVLAHHLSVRYIAQFRKLFQYKIQIFFVRCHIFLYFIQFFTNNYNISPTYCKIVKVVFEKTTAVAVVFRGA